MHNEIKSFRQTDRILSVDNTKPLKGIMAFIIIFSHLRNCIPYFNDTYIGSILTASGYLTVGMFFFFTGYGLCESYNNKKNYYDTFFRNRIVTFYSDCMLFCIIYCIYYLIIGKEINFQGILTTIFVIGGKTYISNGWYLQVAGFIYVCFWLVHKITKQTLYQKLLLLVLFIFYIIYCCYYIEHYSLYIQSISGLALGCLCSWEKEIFNRIMSRWKICLIVSFIFFSVTVIIGNWYSMGILRPIIKMISVIFFIIFCFCILKILPIKCKITKFIGKISLELYAIHGIFLSIFNKTIATGWDALIYAGEVIVFSVCSATILNLVINRMNGFIKNPTFFCTRKMH